MEISSWVGCSYEEHNIPALSLEPPMVPYQRRTRKTDFLSEPSIDFTCGSYAFVRFFKSQAFVPISKLPELAPYDWLLQQSFKVCVDYTPNPLIEYQYSWVPLMEYVLEWEMGLGVGP